MPNPSTYSSQLTRENVFQKGASVGRFFGVHDDELRGWNRAGTLPPNDRAMAYSPIGQDESVAPVVTPPSMSPQNSPGNTLQRGRGRGGRLGRWKQTVTSKFGRKDNLTREQVMKTLPTFWPVMTVLIALAEIALLIATIVTGGLAPIRFTPDSVTGTVTGFDNVTDTGYREVVPNFFIGTTKAALVHTGAMYTPVSVYYYSETSFIQAPWD